jgi:predicted Ser/Thr protein kinase
VQVLSDVYHGTWRGRTVAVKLLAGTLPRDLFLREVDLLHISQHEDTVPL